MNERINIVLNSIFYIGVLGLTITTPFLFWNLTSEFYETPKFLAVSALVLLLLVVWGVKFILEGKATITRTSLDLPFIILLGIIIISTFFSASRPVAIFGNLPRLHGGLASFTLYITAYFLLVSNLKHLNMAKAFISTTIISGVVLAIVTLASYFGKNLLSLSWTAGLDFTPTGAAFSTTALLAIFSAFPLMLILQGKSDAALDIKKPTLSISVLNIVLSVTLALFAITIILTGSFASYVALAAAYILALFTTPQATIKKHIPLMALPIIAAVAAAFLSFVPVGGKNNILYAQAQKFPHEIQLPFDISWKISISAFRDAPIWGTGPASYLFNFTAYKPLELNTTKYWNIRFDQAFNEYLQILATLGITGFIAMLLLTSAFISAALKVLSTQHDSLAAPLAIAGITFFILLALHSSTLPIWVMGILVMALFMSYPKRQNEQINIALERGEKRSGLHFESVPTILLLLIITFAGYFGYNIGKVALADYYHRQALNSVANNQALQAYTHLVKAERLNPEADLYRTDLAQTNFALANAIALSKTPNDSDSNNSLTDQDKQNIQTLLSQAIAEGRMATTLSPNNAGNWEVLGSIYRQISGVAQNALAFSLDSYGQAIQKDPVNPLLRLSVGGIYYSVKNYDLAIRFFTDAANLKPDYANAYYNLSITLRDKGDIAGAIVSAEKTVSLTDPKSGDYKVATDLLTALRSKTSTESAKANSESELTPASKTSSALEDAKLPKVINLPKPDKVSTPAAVKKAVTPIPETSPTPGE